VGECLDREAGVKDEIDAVEALMKFAVLAALVTLALLM
jgi:hypothetical protein